MNDVQKTTQAILNSAGRTGNSFRVARGETMAEAIQRAAADAKASLPFGVVFELRSTLPGRKQVAAWYADMAEQGNVTGMLSEPIEYPNRGVTVYGRLAA